VSAWGGFRFADGKEIGITLLPGRKRPSLYVGMMTKFSASILPVAVFRSAEDADAVWYLLQRLVGAKGEDTPCTGT
jgi:hypothetical protein